MKQILFRLFENLKQLGIKPNIGSRTNVTPIPGSEIDRLINRPVTPKEFDYSKPEVVDSMRGIIQNASDYVGQFTERQLKTFNNNVERILGIIKPKETTADVVDLATKEKITGPGLESLMKEKGVASISRKTIEAETLIKQFLDDDLISLNAKQIDQLSRGKAEDVFENIFGSKAKELITGKNTNESLNEVYNKLKTTKDVKGRLPDDPNFDPSDINFKDGGSVSEDVKQLLKEEFIELINANPELFPDTNAGFRRFLKRKGSPVFNYKDGGRIVKRKKEKKEGDKLGPEDPLSKYESYSEEELAGNIEAKKPNFDTLEDYIMETMPMFEPRDVAPPKSYSPMPVEEYLRGRDYMDLAEGGLSNLIKSNIAPEYRLYTRTMIPGLKTGTLDENYFPDDFKLDLRKQALDKYSRTGKLSGIVNEIDQHISRGKINKLTKFPSTYAALGTYSYEIDPKTLDVKVKDKYDWNPAYGTQGNYTGFVGNEPQKGGRDVDASILKDYAVNTMKRGIDLPAGLELLGNLLGPRASKGEGVDIDINIPTEFAAMRADTPYAYGGRVSMSDGGLTTTVPPAKGPDSQGVESLFRRRYN